MVAPFVSETGAPVTTSLRKVFDKEKICFRLGFGTLLGAVREQGFIKGDSDVDLFFSLDGLEDGSAPEELSMDLDPLPDFESKVPISPPQVYTSSETSVAQSNKNELIPQLLQIQTEDEFVTLVPPQGTSEAILEEYARFALEDLDIVASQPFPYGESHLYLVHVNNMYALIALKQNKYTLLQAFSTLPEGVETAETAEGLKSKDGTLQVTWNASSYNEHIFNLHLGAWHALVVEDSQTITLMK